MSIKKYTNNAWVDIPYKKYETATDTYTSLPQTIIGDGTAISAWSMKGNMSQSGTPTPSNPIYPQECGDLVTTGEHAGQYEIPISFDNNTYTFYLSEPIRKIGDSVDTAPSSGTASRVIVKKRITQISQANNFSRGFTVDIPVPAAIQTIYSNVAISTSELPASNERDGKVWINSSKTYIGFGATEQYPISGSGNPTIEERAVFQSYLDNNEVYVWYVLATPTTETFTAPTIPTSGTAQSFDVDTTLKPSEVSLTYHGWHEHTDTKYSNP